MNSSGLSATTMMLDKLQNRNEYQSGEQAPPSIFKGKKLHAQTKTLEKQLEGHILSDQTTRQDIFSRLSNKMTAYKAGSVLYSVGCGFFTADAFKQIPRSPNNIIGCTLFLLGSTVFLYDAFKD